MAPLADIPDTEEDLEKAPWCFQDYQVVILTESSYCTAKLVSEYCHKKGKKFICADAHGVFGRVFNDFGDAFELLDKKGEDL
jgi:molybdopterin/thiamine biosynthesis adenylyltransferase